MSGSPTIRCAPTDEACFEQCHWRNTECASGLHRCFKTIGDLDGVVCDRCNRWFCGYHQGAVVKKICYYCQLGFAYRKQRGIPEEPVIVHN